MRRLLGIAALALLLAASAAAQSRVQTKTARYFTASAQYAIQPDSTPTVGNLMVIVCSAIGTATMNTPPTGFSTAAGRIESPFTSHIFYRLADGTESPPFRCTFGGSLKGAIHYVEYTGVTDTLDAAGSGSFALGSTTVSTGSVSSTGPALLFGMTHSTQLSVPWGGGFGTASYTSGGALNDFTVHTVDQFASSGGSYVASGSTTNGNHQGILVAFALPAAAGGGASASAVRLGGGGGGVTQQSGGTLRLGKD